MALIGFPLGLGGAAGTWYFGTGHEVTSDVRMYMLVSMSLSMMILGFYCAISPLVSRILVLEERVLVVPGLFNDSKIPKSQISGYRIFLNQGVNVLQLNVVAPNGSTKNTNVTMLFKPDEAFVAWFSDIQNIDAAEFAASLQQVQADERLGDTPEDRILNASKARKIGGALNIISLLSAGWAVLYPHPYTLMFGTIASLPLVALWLCWRYEGAFTIEDNGKKTVRSDLTPALIMPGFILSIRALSDVRMLDATQLILPTLVGLAFLMSGIVWVAPIYRQKLGKFVLISTLMSAYSASAIAMANLLLDNGPRERLLVPVLSKHSTTGNRASHYLRIPAWGPFVEINEVEVPHDLYQRTDVGQKICLSVHSGALGLGWYSADQDTICRR
jgi:hypothetical protein